MKFKRLIDGRNIELAEYVTEYLQDETKPKIQLYVGCDSQSYEQNESKSRHTRYVDNRQQAN